MERALVRETSPSLLSIPTPRTRRGHRLLPIHNRSIYPAAANTWGGLASGVELVVSTERLNRCTAVGDLTVTVEAGTKFADLQAILAKLGNFSPSIQLPQRQQQ